MDALLNIRTSVPAAQMDAILRARIFLCMLAYYVEWHMREAWRELMFADTDQAAKLKRDPVAPAVRSNAAQAKASSHTPDGRWHGRTQPLGPAGRPGRHRTQHLPRAQCRA